MKPSRTVDYLNFAATVLVIVVAVYAVRDLIQARPSPQPKTRQLILPTKPLPLAGMSSKGSDTAQVAMVQFSDFECSYCKKFAVETLPLLDKQYFETGQVLFGFRHYPEPNGHPRALPMARAAACAGRAGKFWQAHDSLFTNPQTDLQVLGDALGLSKAVLSNCLSTIDSEVIDPDRRLGVQLQIQATPVFFIGKITGQREMKVSQLVVGAQPFDVFRRALERAIK